MGFDEGAGARGRLEPPGPPRGLSAKGTVGWTNKVTHTRQVLRGAVRGEWRRMIIVRRQM